MVLGESDTTRRCGWIHGCWTLHGSAHTQARLVVCVGGAHEPDATGRELWRPELEQDPVVAQHPPEHGRGDWDGCATVALLQPGRQGADSRPRQMIPTRTG